MRPTMSLDSVSSPQHAPLHAPTSTVQVIGRRWAVAAGHAVASEAAACVLWAGGNAIDAGVAAGLTLGVVHPDMVSVAGVAPILVHVARTGETFQVSGVGPYPRASSVAYFRERHGGQRPPGLPRTVVPAAPDAWLTALERWGTMSFGDVARAATEHAERGFPVSTFSAYQMATNADKYRRWPTSVALFLRDERAYRAGEILVQRELGETLRRMARAEANAGGSREAGIRAARDEVHRGEMARRLAEVHRASGGPLTDEDLAEAPRAPVGAGAWPEMPPAGDPHRLTAERRREAALPLAGGSHPAQSGRETDALDTSYVAVVDGAGNGFSATPSDPNVDSPVVPGVGCVVSPRGSQGWLDPQHPSVVAPGKRPRLTPAPAMAFTGGRLFMAFGTPGGDVQQQAMLQVFLNVTVFGMEPQAAVEAPRLASRSFPDSFWPHAVAPGKVEIERRIPRETRDALAALGHVVAEWPEFEWRAGAVCAVRVGPDGTRWARADPRRGSLAIAR